DKNKRSLGSFFKNKKDGGTTQAYQQFQDMDLKSGSIVEIGFKEVPYKDGTIKNILGFREPNIMATPQQTTQSQIVQPRANSSVQNEYKAPTQDAFGRRLAIHGLINGLLAGGTLPQDVNVEA
ncbi:hypothetical protein OEZ83_27110, partial [Leclercia adecarboxylata]|uniref:hypothetical protein n=1 Tax=Leclercia adecarboxylata TaxID=83655 RepID=UPI00234C3DEF